MDILNSSDNTSTVRTGTVTVWPQFDYPQTGSVITYPYYVWTNPEPWTCVGKAHVFECDHERKCKCGKVTRVMPKAPKAK